MRLWKTLHYVPDVEHSAALRALSNKAVLAGWVAARENGMRHVRASDAIAEAAVAGVFEQLEEWEAESKQTGWPERVTPIGGVERV